VRVDGIGLSLDADGASARLHYTWPEWSSIGYTERLKHGAAALADAFRDVVR